MLLIGHIPIAITLAVPRGQASCPKAANCLQYDLYTFFALYIVYCCIATSVGYNTIMLCHVLTSNVVWSQRVQLFIIP